MCEPVYQNRRPPPTDMDSPIYNNNNAGSGANNNVVYDAPPKYIRPGAPGPRGKSKRAKNEESVITPRDPPHTYYNEPDRTGSLSAGGGATMPNRQLRPGELHYGIEDVPPWYLSVFLGFQHYLIMFGATMANPMAIAPYMCLGDEPEHNVAKSEIIGTIFVVSGIVTFLQATLGVRLPIVQGGTFTFVAPTIAILSLDKWKCYTEPDPCSNKAAPVLETQTADYSTSSYDPTTVPYISNFTEDDNVTDPIWMNKMREIQGAIMVASLFQLVIGFTGLMGFMLKFIGPLAIAPTISLAGLALFDVAAASAAKQWWITLVTVVLIVAFSQYSRNFQIPCFRFKKGEGCVRVGFPLFRLFPVILAIALTWIICLILTVTKVFPSDPNESGSGAATNLRTDVLDSAKWFRVPYPFQWGIPTVSVAAVFGMLAGVLASMMESVGDYYACARMSGAPPPPMHAINRGIGIEGLGCILAGMFGTSTGTTSYSENIGAIGITKVASRRVIQVGSAVMILFGTFGKFGALFVTIPDPIIGGVFIVMFGMITAVGLSNLQFVDLNSSRNLFIIGFTFFFGLTLPRHIQANPDTIKTGNDSVDQIFTVLLSTSMFVGGLSGFVLDNTIPGSDEERGLVKWRKELIQRRSTKRAFGPSISQQQTNCYEIEFLSKRLRRYKWAKYVPFLPTFDDRLFSCPGRSKEEKKRKKSKNGAPPPSVDEVNEDTSMV